uniref:Syndecan n=1 Tax=Heterorhabditis bacteriophora TaxID=37862 RepID=A0A1I7XLM4_HETBA
MAGVYVLLAFVLLVFVVGTVLMIVCYQRSKNKERKEQREAAEYNGYSSQVGVGAPGAYSSYGGPTY